MTNARSQLSAGNISLVFPINPTSATWSYTENSTSQDTIGGRVVQLLSVRVEQLNVQAVAGSRKELQRITEGVRKLMEYHVRTSRPAHYRVPSRGWDFTVYVTALPQVGWDVAATTYPFSLAMSVEDDISGLKTKQLRGQELSRLANGIGYNPGVHGGDAGTITDLVKSLTAVAASYANAGGAGGSAATGSPGPGGGANSPSSSERWRGDNKWPGKAASAPWEGKSLRDAVYGAWAYAGGPGIAQRAMCIVDRESGWNPAANNGLPPPPLNPNGSWDLGLHQVNTLYAGRRPSQGWVVTGTLPSGLSWWPSDYRQMFDPEYNTRCAIDIFQRYGNTLNAWATVQSNQC